jgi:hypothetical protein
MVPQYQLQIKEGNTWKDCGEHNHRYDPIRREFGKLALAMQQAKTPAGTAIRVVDKAKSYTPVYDEWERIS